MCMNTPIVDFRQIPAFCINLDRRQDRWKQAQSEFARVGWPITRWPAVTSETPMRGCLESHRTLWSYAVTHEIDVLAVFEDDCIFARDFIDIFEAAKNELPVDWQFWQLHSFHAKTEIVSKYITRIRSCGWGTHGYLVRPAAYKKFLSLKQAQPDALVTCGYLAAGGCPYGVSQAYTLCFQRGADSDIAATAQTAYWRRNLLRYSRRD